MSKYLDDEGLQHFWTICKSAYNNPNMLDNSDFRQPVNQRGIADGSEINAAGYHFDRWKIMEDCGRIKWSRKNGLQMLTPTSGMSLGCRYRQYIELPAGSLQGQTVTFSVLYPSPGGDSVHSATMQFPGLLTEQSSSSTANIGGNSERRVEIGFEYRSGGASVCGSTASYLPYVELNGFWYDVYIGAVKLERGAISTLAANPPPCFAEELVKCQRYLFKLSSLMRYSMLFYTGGYIDFFIPMPQTMLPGTTAFSGTMTVVVPGGSGDAGYTFAVSAATESGLIIRASKSLHGRTTAALQIAAGGMFSREY